MRIRDRIKEFRRVKASELMPNPKNWRTHPPEQADALRGILAEVGWAGAVLARETSEGLMLIDGHLRAEVDADSEIPVLVLDVDQTEADKILATFDPLSAMAEVDEKQLGALLEGMEAGSEALGKLIEDLERESDRLSVQFDEKGENDPDEEWRGMPECESEDLSAWNSVKVNFDSVESMQQFSNLVEQTITEKTQSIWFPKAKIGRYADKRYVNES